MKNLLKMNNFQRQEPHLDLHLKDLDGELWRSVVGYEGLYSVSNLGRIRSESRMRPHSGFILGRIMKYKDNGRKCVFLNLSKDGIKHSRNIPGIVADAWIEKKRDGRFLVVMHKNKNPLDNRVDNLEIVTRSVSRIRDLELNLIPYTSLSKAEKANGNPTP